MGLSVHVNSSFLMTKSLGDQALEAINSDNLDKFMEIVPAQIPLSAVVNGKPILIWAIEACAMRCIQYMLDEGVDMYQSDASGKSPLHIAVIRNQKQPLIMLLNAGADPNCADGDGWTPLHWAVQLENKRFVSILCGLDANPDMEDYEGVTPRRIAEQRHNRELLSLFPPREQRKQSAFSGCSFLFKFCQGDPDIVQLPSRKRDELP